MVDFVHRAILFGSKDKEMQKPEGEKLETSPSKEKIAECKKQSVESIAANLKHLAQSFSADLERKAVAN